MKTISISDNAHKNMTEEIKKATDKKVYPALTYGTIVEDMTTKRYKKKN
jgi:hypothetical protein